ncbi:hypothetical protein ACFE04_008302 [Oxalis oulophora]
MVRYKNIEATPTASKMGKDILNVPAMVTYPTVTKKGPNKPRTSVGSSSDIMVHGTPNIPTLLVTMYIVSKTMKIQSVVSLVESVEICFRQNTAKHKDATAVRISRSIPMTKNISDVFFWPILLPTFGITYTVRLDMG